MTETVIFSKDEDQQQPVPNIWRNTISLIVEAMKEGDFKIERGIAGVRPISSENAMRIAKNIRSYGASLTALSEETWRTSACQWMRGYWEVLVDLFTVEEGRSDLALSMRVYEEGNLYIYEISGVYVP